jgi:hypothetical protein
MTSLYLFYTFLSISFCLGISLIFFPSFFFNFSSFHRIKRKVTSFAKSKTLTEIFKIRVAYFQVVGLYFNKKVTPLETIN